jgi:hypothetical protein
MDINNHIITSAPAGLKPSERPSEDTSDLVTASLDVDAIWADWNRAGRQGQRFARPGEANGEDSK